MSQRKYTPEFRAGICIQILQGDREIVELASEHDINPYMIRNWTDEFIRNAGRVFEETLTIKEAQRKEDEFEQELDLMLKTIAKLTMERDYLQDCFRRSRKPIPVRERDRR